MSGNNGRGYDLWWAPQGSPPATSLDRQEGDILVRAARHHDDHAPLNVETLDEYLPLGQQGVGAALGSEPICLGGHGSVRKA